ncbi:MAG: hypothetical protein M1840_007565 [Geoglossum simile]|nr:MAG: hypothetical protein M1840_007565 [Geoglossum simile]
MVGAYACGHEDATQLTRTARSNYEALPLHIDGLLRMPALLPPEATTAQGAAQCNEVRITNLNACVALSPNFHLVYPTPPITQHWHITTKFFVGSYTKAYLNLSMEDLIFRIPAGPKAGVISIDSTTRPVQILLAPTDGDGDGPLFGSGQDFQEAEPLSSSVSNFQVTVSGIDNTKADINIQYGIDRKPDPAIRKWPASPSRPWQSPDIEVPETLLMPGGSMCHGLVTATPSSRRSLMGAICSLLALRSRFL